MQSLLFIMLFIFGAFTGSFLNLISDRLPNGRKIVFGRSICDFCKKNLKVKNLVPMFSFLFQKGKCSFCGEKLSFYYPFSEFFTGAVFMLAGYLSGFVNSVDYQSAFILLYYIIVFSFFVAMFLTDIKYYLILDSLIIPAVVFVFLSSVVFRGIDLINLHRQLSNDSLGVYLLRTDYFTNHVMYSLKDFGFVLLGASIISLFFLFLIFITRGRGMGFGDVKLGFLIGLVNGFPLSIIAIFLGFILGAVYSVSLIFMKKKSMKDTIAFGPFLIMGSLLTFLFGSSLWHWYIQIGSISSMLGVGF
ncbi:prepilin peptidase [Patescibacteria group bacterium]|nr:prepilin peptidase [Patescibacteria group bacterium]